MSSLYDVIQSHVDEALSYLYTCLPARVDGVKEVEGMTVVKATPLVNRLSQENYADQEPALENVPVQWPSGGSFVITCPIEVGDTVLLHFAMRSMMEFKKGDASKPVTPSNKRLHNQMDAFAVPTKLSYANGTTVDKDAMRIGSDKMEIRITKEGNIEFGKGATEKLVLGDEFLKLYNALSVPTGVGPSGPPLTPMDAALHLSQKVTTE